MERTGEAMVRLVGAEVCGNPLSLPQLTVTDEFLVELFNVSQAHDVAHLVGSALLNNNLLIGSNAEGQYRNAVYSSIYRYEKLKFSLEQLSEAFEQSEIAYIPLKGAVIRDLYPQPWMRTSCDIDFLVHKEDSEKAVKLLTDSLGYTLKDSNGHDISLLSPEGICVELHFSLLENNSSYPFAKQLEKVWGHASRKRADGYEYGLDEAMLYFYHIAHMAKHFINGGCGIRPFLDLWLIKNQSDTDTDEINNMLSKGGLFEFAQFANVLSDVWFSGGEHDEVTLLMQEYIFNGGCFGSAETRMLSNSWREGGKSKFVLSRVFVPYEELKRRYPIVKKYRFLVPLCEICRLFSLLFGKKRAFRKSYLLNIKNIPEEQLEKANVLFEKIGLA